MTRNLPVPAGPRAPVSWHWAWYIGPPAAITWLYRTLLPPDVRSWWSLRSPPTSHLALALILAGYGWGAFWRFVIPSLESGWWKGGPLTFPAWVSPHMLDRGGKKGWYVNGRIRGPQLGWKEDYGRGDRVL
jgi:hypothetical protein